MNDLYEAIRDRPDYTWMEGTVFHDWIETRTQQVAWKRVGWPGGYKIHVSIHEDDAQRGAALVLPVLRNGLRFRHKIVSTPGRYARLNLGNQRGKLITVYCGPSMDGFTRTVNLLDPLLVRAGLRPGPRPLQRRGAVHGEAEPAVGLSGLITYTTSRDFAGG